MDQFYEQAQQILLYVMMVATPMYLINRLQTDSLAGKLLINSISFVMCITFTWLVILFCSFMYVINGLFTIMLPAVIALLLFCAYRVLRERGLDKRFVYLFLGYAVAIFVGPPYNVIELKGSSLFRVPTKDRSYILFYSHSHLWVISRENKDYI